jgi:hypothetical protein
VWHDQRGAADTRAVWHDQRGAADTRAVRHDQRGAADTRGSELGYVPVITILLPL